MKKIIFTLSLVLSSVVYSIAAYGQITITKATTRTQIIALDPFNQCGIGINEQGYFLFSSTSNRFDDAFFLYLGQEKDNAKQTIASLIDLVDIVNTQNVTFQDPTGTSFTARKIFKGLTLSSSNHSGDVHIARSLLSWLLVQIDTPDGGPWDSINDAVHGLGSPTKVASVVAGGQIQKMGSAIFLTGNNDRVYLGNSIDDAIMMLKDYEAFASSSEQEWPVIIINTRVSGKVTNAREFGAKTAYIKPSDRGTTIPLYQIYLKKYIKALEK